MATKKNDDRVTKRRVTMKSIGLTPDGSTTLEYEANDYVRPDHLEAYVADAQTRWQSVTVSDEPDAGPAGYEGQTAVPAHLDVPDAGQVYPAENQEK